ncbi:MAG: RidA family protein [Bacteroidia bacterium]
MMKEIVHTAKAPNPIGPYNQAVKAGNTLYCSGQIAIDPENGELLRGSVGAETRQVMENLKYILEEAEMALSDVVKCSIFLRNMDDFTIVNEVYGAYFIENFPARETVQVARLPKDARVEISLIAVKA